MAMMASLMGDAARTKLLASSSASASHAASTRAAIFFYKSISDLLSYLSRQSTSEVPV